MSIWQTPTLWKPPIHDDHKYTSGNIFKYLSCCNPLRADDYEWFPKLAKPEASWDNSNGWSGVVECHSFTTITTIFLLYDTLWESSGIRGCDLLLWVIFKVITEKCVVWELKLLKWCSSVLLIHDDHNYAFTIQAFRIKSCAPLQTCCIDCEYLPKHAKLEASWDHSNCCNGSVECNSFTTITTMHFL